MDYYDITPEISEEMAVYPGDEAFKREVSMDLQKGSHLTLSSIKTTLHIGAHADAPCHYVKGGPGISERDLNYYMGPCQVIKTSADRGSRLDVSILKGLEIKAPRVLFCTNSYPNPQEWNSDFNSLSPELIEKLSNQSVITVGIDTPSIDPWDSKDLPSHLMVAQKNMAILEGLVLDEVPEGLYDLIALPLKIKNVDASPVRAILKPI